jgi:2-polyprenyl-6-methoxyphenol hydroxylase-like FAD-dependent oxidoreductase
MKLRRTQAVVLGGSVAGLAAAHALAPRFDRVVVLERHALPDGTAPVSIAPQGAFPHVLLAGGARALEDLVPGFADACFERGAVGDLDGHRPCHWWAAGRVRRHIPDLGVRVPMCSRPLVEDVLRTLLAARPNVTTVGSTRAEALLVERGAVRGVRGGTECWDADLVVDATGRASAGAGWWDAEDAGPERVRVSVTYTAVEVRRKPGDLDGGLLAVVQHAPGSPRIGVALPAEDDRWMVVLGGYFGERAPRDRDGMLAFARALPDPVVAGLLEGEWLTAPGWYGFPASERRDWRDRRPPAGFVPVGDAVASFNPLYGQGMSSAALQATEVARALDHDDDGPMAVRAVARVAANPWRIATGADFVHEETVGTKPRGTDTLNRYLARVMAAAAVDDRVNLALSRVQHLLAAPPSLLSPPVVRAVLRAS